MPGAAGGSVSVLGGLTTGNATTASVVNLAVPAGTPTAAGALANPTHDAAGTILGGRVLVFGGGVLSSFSTVQAYPLTAAGASATGVVVGQLPQARSDAAAVTIGRTAYVVGGYDGTVADPQVLSTTDGSSFHSVGSLPVPVRYPAVAALGRMIYVFGGQQVGGAAGAVTAIQGIDTASGKIEVVGHLPQALLGASAVTLGGVIYVAGGSTGPSDSGVIYAFDPVKGQVLVAGHLIAPLSNAAVATVAGTAWLVGGESGTHPDRRRADAQAQHQVRHRGRARGRLAVLRREAAHRRPRQQPAAGPRRHRRGDLDVSEPAVHAAAARARVGSTSPTTPSSSRTARRSSRTRRRTRRSSRSATRAARSCGATAIPPSRARHRATSTSPTTRTC